MSMQEKGSEGFLVGHNEKQEPIMLSQKDMALHTAICGHGPGQAKLLADIAAQAVCKGWGVLFISTNVDPCTYLTLRHAAESAGRIDDLKVISPNGAGSDYGLLSQIGTHSYNPMMGIKNKNEIVSILQEDNKNLPADSFWRTIIEEHMGAVVDAFLSTEKPWTHRDAVAALSNSNALRTLLLQVESKGAYASPVLRMWLDVMDEVDTAKHAAERETLRCCRSFFSHFDVDGMGDMLCTTRPDVSMREVWSEQQICYAALPGITMGRAAGSLGKLILSELWRTASASAKETGVRKPFLVAVDDSCFVGPYMANILDNGRSKGVAIAVEVDRFSSAETLVGRTRNKLLFGEEAGWIIRDLAPLSQQVKNLSITAQELESTETYSEFNEAVAEAAAELASMGRSEFLLRSGDSICRGKVTARPADWEASVDVNLCFKPTITDEGGIGIYTHAKQNGN